MATTSRPIRVAVLIGSLRAGSFSRKIAQALIERAPQQLACSVVEIGELPLYNEDLDAGSPPAAWSKFRQALQSAQAIIFVTPEYNRSVPGVLKNALDVGSRPENQSVFTGKPAAVVGVSPYSLGAFGANHALRQTFSFLDMPVLQQPEMYLGNVKDVIDDAGKVKSVETEKLLQKFMTTFGEYAGKLTGSHTGADVDLAAFMKKREGIARDYVNGKPESLTTIVTHSDPATFFSPRGEVVKGAETIAARYTEDSASFSSGSKSELEVLQSHAGDDLAFWTGLQRAEVKMAKDGKVVPMVLRITEVYRREGGELKLVHRHADMKDA